MSTVISGADRRAALPIGIRAPLAVVGVFGAVVAVVLGVMFAGQHTGTGLDRRLAAAFALSEASPAYAVSWHVQTLADPIPALILVLLVAAVCLRCGRRRLALLAVVGPAVADVAVISAKHLVGRTIQGSLSYPSTHTAHFVAFAMVVALLVVDMVDLDGAVAAALVLGSGAVGALVMGWALVANGVHYPTDTLAGLCVAIAVIPVSAWCMDLLGGKPSANRRVGLFGNLGSGNLGNDGSLDAVVSYLRHIDPNVQVRFLCMGAEEVAARYGGSAVSLQWYEAHAGNATRLHAAGLKVLGRLLDPFRTLAWVRHNDVVIVAGMGVLEATVPLRPWGFQYSLFWLAIATRLTGARLALVSVGSDVVRARAARWFLTHAARLAHYRTFPDELSGFDE